MYYVSSLFAKYNIVQTYRANKYMYEMKNPSCS